MKKVTKEQLDRAFEVLHHIHGGRWSWEETKYNGQSSWDLYADRGEPIFKDQPIGLSNRQHGLKIMRGEPDTFDSTGEAMREFILLAREMLPHLLFEVSMWRSSFTHMYNAAYESGVRMETPEQAKERRLRAIQALSEDYDPDYVDLEDDAIKE